MGESRSLAHQGERLPQILADDALAGLGRRIAGARTGGTRVHRANTLVGRRADLIGLDVVIARAIVTRPAEIGSAETRPPAAEAKAVRPRGAKAEGKKPAKADQQ